jgi:hypothetical protein
MSDLQYSWNLSSSDAYIAESLLHMESSYPWVLFSCSTGHFAGSASHRTVTRLLADFGLPAPRTVIKLWLPRFVSGERATSTIRKELSTISEELP